MRSTIGGKVLIGGVLAAAMLVMLSAGSLVAHEDHATPEATDASDGMGMMGEATPGAADMMSGQTLHEAMHAMMGMMNGGDMSGMMADGDMMGGDQMTGGMADDMMHTPAATPAP